MVASGRGIVSEKFFLLAAWVPKFVIDLSTKGCEKLILFYERVINEM